MPTDTTVDIYEEGSLDDDLNKVDATEEKETSEDSQSDKKTTDESEETSDETEENLPFHKHPRWKKIQGEKEQLASQVEDLTKKVEELAKAPVKEEPVTLPNWWKEQYGDEEASVSAYKQYLSNNEKFKDEVVDKAVAKLRAEQDEAKKAQEQADQYFEEQLTKLEEEGKTFDRNELKKFMLDFETKHGIPIVYTEGKHKGFYNFEAAYELMTEMNKEPKPATQKKKEIAGGSMTRGTQAANDGIPVFNRGAFRDGSWRDIIKN